MVIGERLASYARFVKIEHTLFSLPLIYAGALLARPADKPWPVFLLILTAAVGARSAAFGLNRIIDLAIDRANPRTQNRELPAGRMRLREAWLVTLAGSVIYFISAGLLGKPCLVLAPLPLIIFVTYPYLKRLTPLAHFGVGLGLAMAPLGGWFAIRQEFVGLGPPILLGLFTWLWVSGFDIIYSTADEDFDRAHRVHSLPGRLGKKRALAVSGLLHFLAFLCLVALYSRFFRSFLALPFLLLTGVLLFLEQRKAHDVELAFFKINAVLGFVVLLLVGVGVSVQP